MTSITPISYNITTSSTSSTDSASGTALTDATKNKLQALGLDITKITTEAQGQAALTQAQQAAVSSYQNSGYATLKREVQDLASKMRVPYSSGDDTSEILNNISVQLVYLQSNAGTDTTKQAQVNSYQSRYTLLSNELSQLQSSNAQLTNTLESLANYNKIALDIARKQ